MLLDFTKLQRLFIEKIRLEESVHLKPSDVSFLVEPNDGTTRNTTYRILVFGNVFSHGYLGHNENENEREEALLRDCYSRLHDYGTDSPQWHIWGLMIQKLEDDYSEQLVKIRNYLGTRFPELKPEEILVDISDVVGEPDANGFRLFALSVYLKGKRICQRILDPEKYQWKLADEIIEALSAENDSWCLNFPKKD